MSDQNHVQKTLDMIVSQIQYLERELAHKKRTANDLCRLVEVPSLFQDVETTSSAGVSTLPDEYYGRQMPEVIRTILEKRKRSNQGPAAVGEIYDAMIAGGYVFQAQKPEYAKRGIYGVLAAGEEFHRLPNGGYGLTEWYPAAKNRAEREEENPKPHRKKLKTRPKSAPAAPPPAKKPDGSNGDLVGPTDAVWQFVREHPGLDRATVIQKVLGRQFATKSANREQLLTSIVRQMVKQNRLRLEGEKVYLVERIAG